MSTPPKEPKPEEARRGGAPNLESTYLGVAPLTPQPVAPQPVAAEPVAAGAAPAATTPPAAPGAPPAAAGSAIIATPMISVSDRNKRADAGQPAVQAPAAAPLQARLTGLQGGWQSAGIPRLGPEQTALHGSPGAWPMPPAAPRQQPSAAPVQPNPPAPAARAATPDPGTGAGLQHTALASDYLRGARDAAQGTDAPPRAVAPMQPSGADFGRQTAYSPVAPQDPRRARQQELPSEPAPLAPMVDLNATAASGGLISPPPVSPPPVSPPPVSPPPVSPPPVSPPPAPAPPTQGPPPTAELSSPLTVHTAAHSPVQVSHAEPERGLAPRHMNTQASVAPPPGELGASFHGPMAAAFHDAAPEAARAAPGPSPMAAAPSPVRHVIPQALVGTMLDRTPSVPGKELRQGVPPPPANPTLRFEQVPPPRSSLAQQATSFGINIPIDHNTTQWGRPAHDGKTKALPGRPPKARSQWRMVLLAALALVSVVGAVFWPQLRDFALAELARFRPDAAGRGGQPATAAAQTTLTNLPAPTPGVQGAAEERAAVEAPAAAALQAPVAAQAALPAAAAEAAGAEDTAAAATLPAAEVAAAEEPEPSSRKARRGAKGRAAKGAAETDAPVAASPESRLAAEAGKHVLAARFADALPLYRNLQRDYPQNTAYAAMARVLEQKLSGEKQGGGKQSGAQP